MPEPLPVPHKEGGIRPHADIGEFLAGRRRAVLLDNNVLASDWGLAQIEKIIRLGVRANFNQGLDARRIARCPEVAELLARVQWLRFLRMAYDTSALRDDVRRAVELLGRCGIPPRKLFFYVLVRDDIDDALRRIRELKTLGCIRTTLPGLCGRYETFARAVAFGLLVQQQAAVQSDGLH